MLRLLRTILPAVFVLFFCYKMACIIVPYADPEPRTTFLTLRAGYFDWAFYRWPLYVHIFPALFVLGAGMTQFSADFTRRFPKIHRLIGNMYVHLTLWLSAPAAVVMAFYAPGGPFTQAAFATQGLLWWFFTLLAWRAVNRNRIREHGIWMLRSYALCTGAITLRVMQYWFFREGSLLSDDSYRLAAWPSWLLNLALAELVLSIWARYPKADQPGPSTKGNRF